MLLDRAVNAPRAGMETRTLTWEEMTRQFRQIFFAGEELGVGISTAE